MSIKRYIFGKKFTIGVLLFLAILCFYFHKNRVDRFGDRKSILSKIDETIKSNTKTGACKLPYLPVYAPEMMKFVKYNLPIECKDAPKDWVVCQNSECRITEQAVATFGRIVCSFTDVLRVNDYAYVDGETTNTDSYYKLEKSDVVKVNCKAASTTWDSMLTSIRFDKEIWDRTGWEYTPDDGLKLNVLMFGIDSLSRNTVIRKLPETYTYLKEELNTLVLEGYNIIGDGTPQALTPMLTGKTELELPETRKRMENANFVDVYPFVWRDYSENGYVTGYLEDCQLVGTYTYRLKGFQNPPTDHYQRTYYKASLKYYKKWPPLCAGSIPRHQVMLDYIKSFFSVYETKPKFMFGFHAELSHDDYNLIGAADKDIVKFFRDLKKSGVLNNTVLIFMADHGHRFAEIRNTMQGKLEERLPFFSFTFPDWFKTKHKVLYENFHDNLKTLTTPFDIHATLKTILHVGNVGPSNLTDRSLSLFSKIPKDRNCASAYIEPHWCSCLEWNQVKLSEPIVQQLGDAFAKTLNEYTESQRAICAELKVSAVYWVSKLTPNENLIRYKKNADNDGFVPEFSDSTQVNAVIYQIKVMMTPGDSIFEATITFYVKENRMEVRLSDISRINMYGRQARCIENDFPQLRKYCYCLTD